MNCTHNWNKGLDSGNKSAFKICTKCTEYQEITMLEYYNFEELKLEEKIKKIVQEEISKHFQPIIFHNKDGKVN